ncbi:MAG: enolase C-terminal domain-like protein [Candidatus Hinthialibacter antarcticus]|nr:enolase C-terminal domain-like protein [Candidatus Hinthialibacter antarcticus]
MSLPVHICDVKTSYEDHAYRAPLKFGGIVTDKVTLLNVVVRVEDAQGRSAQGFGSMPLGNVWSFPSKVHSYDETLAAMKALADAIQSITNSCSESGHPVELSAMLEPHYLKAAEQVSNQLQLKEPIPKLCALVVACTFDAAIHDAYGKLHGVSSYAALGGEFLTSDLSEFLDERFKGESLQQYVSPEPKPRMPLYHLVGAVDPLEECDIAKRLNDGMPETLPEWIRHDGLTHLKIKLNGDNLDWDVERVARVDQITEETQREQGVDDWVYSLDFNERCESVDYLLAFLAKIEERAPRAMQRAQYIEQPTARDLKAHPENKMHKAAAIKPVVIDESLVDYETLLLAREQGYTGVALKACKGISQALLMGAAAQKFDMFLCVQDLTCPGASFLLSAGLAAHVPPVAAIEGNARQYVPGANHGWADRYPTVFTVAGGSIDTSSINGPGLGVEPLSS